MLDMTIFSFGSPHIISKKTFLLRVKKEADIGRYDALALCAAAGTLIKLNCLTLVLSVSFKVKVIKPMYQY